MSLIVDLLKLPDAELRSRLRGLCGEELELVMWGGGSEDDGILACEVAQAALEERLRRISHPEPE